MASVIVVLGSILGFAAAIAGWLLFDLSLLAGLAIWIGSGPAAALIAVAAGGAPRPAAVHAPEPAMAEA